MKTCILFSAIASLSALAACQSSNVNSAARSFEPAGGQARYDVAIPADAGATAPTQPFALQGSSDTVAAPQNFGYQAR